VLAALCAVGYAVLTVGDGFPPTEAGAAVAALVVLDVVEFVLDESSI
jgi:hypothetical protein